MKKLVAGRYQCDSLCGRIFSVALDQKLMCGSRLRKEVGEKGKQMEKQRVKTLNSATKK